MTPPWQLAEIMRGATPAGGVAGGRDWQSIRSDYGLNGNAGSFSPATGVLAPSQITTHRELVPD